MAPNIPALIATLQSGDAALQQAAAEQLAQLGTDAQPAAVELVEACAGDDEVREWANSALEGVGPPLLSDINRLIPLLQNPSLDVAYWAATLLGRLGPQAAVAIAALMTVADGHVELAVRQRAVWALGQIGSPAAPALPVLQAAAQSADPRLAALAREAIAAIHR